MAIRGLDVPATGLTAYSAQLAVVGNNLTNVDTNGFKRSDMRFQDMLYEIFQFPGKRSIFAQTGVGILYGQGVGIANNPTIFQQGPFVKGTDLDWAINGEGFFRVTDASGNKYLTRLGAFQPKGLGSSGPINLQISGQTYELDPPITLPGENSPTTINSSGLVEQGSFSAQVELVRVQNVDGLEQVGDLLFRETAASGESTTGIPGSDGFGQTLDQTLEGSNVDISTQFLDLIQSSQSFNLNTQTFATSDQEIQRAVALAQQS